MTCDVLVHRMIQEPRLSPSGHKISVPNTTRGKLCGSKAFGSSKRPFRGPKTITPLKAPMPPVMWTTMDPAKSVNPTPWAQNSPVQDMFRWEASERDKISALTNDKAEVPCPQPTVVNACDDVSGFWTYLSVKPRVQTLAEGAIFPPPQNLAIHYRVVCVFFAFAGAVLMVTGCYLINKNLVFRSVLACWHCWLLWRNLISIHTSHTSVFFGFFNTINYSSLCSLKHHVTHATIRAKDRPAALLVWMQVVKDVLWMTRRHWHHCPLLAQPKSAVPWRWKANHHPRSMPPHRGRWWMSSARNTTYSCLARQRLDKDLGQQN